jgi:hypothetical protein
MTKPISVIEALRKIEAIANDLEGTNDANGLLIQAALHVLMGACVGSNAAAIEYKKLITAFAQKQISR